MNEYARLHRRPQWCYGGTLNYKRVKMKIVLAHKQLDLRGGPERVVCQTAIGLRDRGGDVHLFYQKSFMAPPAGVVVDRVTCRVVTPSFFGSDRS